MKISVIKFTLVCIHFMSSVFHEPTLDIGDPGKVRALVS